MKKNIVLSGFMGTGKSTVGMALAERLRWGFVDTDDQIEKLSGMKISKIFSEFGEDVFRRFESLVVCKVSELSNYVISVGGGTVVDPFNRDILSKNAFIITFMAQPEVIYSRVYSTKNRPLLNLGSEELILNQIKNLLERRMRYYCISDFILDTSFKEIFELVDEIIEHIYNIVT
ncbi:shikimate kinase [Thermodesulfobium sp. 4217-1]|uniref:shikimate kinase n=1 Tax=Thermodesulfobium sp. 4217-1 TaxID=3120013 RepID=UPI0032218B8F